MDKQTISVSPGIFQSAFIPAASVLSVLAALFGFGSVLLLFEPSSVLALIQDLFIGGITSASALQTWKIIHIAITPAVFLCPAIMAVSLILTLQGQSGKGLNLLYTFAQWFLYGVNLSGIAVLIMLVYRAANYTITCFSSDEGPYYLYSMLISEALMVAQAWFLFVNLRRFLNCVCDSTASISYTLLTGKLDTVSIPGFTATGFLLLAIFNIVLSLDRLFTMTIAGTGSQVYYSFLIASHPIHYLSGAALLFGAVADVLLFIYLRKYKSISEGLIFRSRG